MQNFTLKFGKHKGVEFLSTPKSYQDWLLKQDWFKAPQTLTAMQQAQKNVSVLSSNLKGWNGYSRNGAATEMHLFQAEMAIEDLMYCDCGNRKEETEKRCWSCG